MSNIGFSGNIRQPNMEPFRRQNLPKRLGNVVSGLPSSRRNNPNPGYPGGGRPGQAQGRGGAPPEEGHLGEQPLVHG